MTANANLSTLSGGFTIRLSVIGNVVNPDSRSITYSRSDNGNTETLALDAGATDDDVQTALQALADSLVRQNAVAAEVVGSTFTGSAIGVSGTHSVTLQVLSATSHADSLTIRYRRNDNGNIDNLAANTDATSDDLRAQMQGMADTLAQQVQAAADDAQGIIGLTVTATA